MIKYLISKSAFILTLSPFSGLNTFLQFNFNSSYMILSVVATAIDTRTKPKKGNPENFKTFRMRELRVEEVNHCIWAKIKILNEYMRYHRYIQSSLLPKGQVSKGKCNLKSSEERRISSISDTPHPHPVEEQVLQALSLSKHHDPL